MPRISEYPVASALAADDIFPITDTSAGVTKTATGDVVRDLVGRGYTRVIDMVREYGCDPTGTNFDTANIQAAWDENKGTSGGVVLYFPAGVYKIGSPGIVMGSELDLDAKVHIKGSGRRGVEIRQESDSSPTFDMRNAGQNLRGVVISDMSLRYGAQQLYLGACAYNLFHNVTFFNGGESATKSVVVQSGSNNNFFDNCWWVHTDSGGDAFGVSSGQVYFTNCTFGEDTGNVYVGDFARFVNCKFQYGEDRVSTSGMSSMGKAQISIPNGGAGEFFGCTMWVTTNMVNMDNASRCKFIGNNIQMGTGAVLKVRNTDSGYPTIFCNNSVTWGAAGTFYASHITEHLQNSVFTGNTFEAATGEVTVDTGLLDPRYRNVWRDNTWRSGAL